MKNNNNRKGFTLVELSIVLVIIGLLIGGILVAQSMIGTAKIQALVRQVGSFDAAVANFQTKFAGLPGDVKAVSGLGGGGGLSDGDGFISKSGATSGTPASGANTGEISQFWKDLTIAGGLSTDGAGASNTPASTYAVSGPLSVGTATATNPKAKAGSNGATFVVAAITTTSATPITSNFYVIADAAQNVATSVWVAQAAGTGALKSTDALSLDTKLDDGVGNTGNVQSALFAAATSIAAPGGVASTGCVAAGTYDVTKTTNDCDIAVRVGINTGTMQ